LTLKQRSIDKGLILIAADLGQLLPYIETPTQKLLQRISASWPGPTTWLIPKRHDTPTWLSGNHDTVAVRVTNHPLTVALCQICNSALISTSANRQGQPPARSALKVRQRFGDNLGYILSGATDHHAQPSEICDAQTGRIIRAGGPVKN
jgi:L-threonylcarbamoyladenylate synthase